MQRNRQYRQSLILQPSRRFTYVTVHSPTLPPLYLCHSSFYSPSVASPTLQARHVLHLASRPCIGVKKQSVVDQLVTKFRSSYSFGQLLRILLRAVNLFYFSRIVSSDSSFNIHNALYFVKYPSRAAQNSLEGRRRPAGRLLETPDVNRRLRMDTIHKKINIVTYYSLKEFKPVGLH